MTDFNTRVKITIGDLVIQQAQLSAALEEKDEKLKETEAKIAALEHSPLNKSDDR